MSFEKVCRLKSPLVLKCRSTERLLHHLAKQKKEKEKKERRKEEGTRERGKRWKEREIEKGEKNMK